MQPVPSPRNGRLRRYLKGAAIAIALVALVGILAIGPSVYDHLRTLRSLRRVPETNLYVLDYYGDYHLNEIRRRGMDVQNIEGSLIETFFPDIIMPIADAIKEYYVPEPTYDRLPSDAEHCSTVACRNVNGHVLFGRNMDWRHDACLILRIHRDGAVRSVAVIDLHYLNLDQKDLEKSSLLERVPLLFAPYYVMDGMNSDGVAVSNMSADGARPPRNDSRPNLMHGTDLRLILDYAKTTEEAVSLIQQYNIHFVESPSHLMIADASGDMRVVEFIDGRLRVTRPDQFWQVCTNHHLWRMTEEENDQACTRYRCASERLEASKGQLDEAALTKVMASVAVPNWTMWTSVYNLSTGHFQVVYQDQYGHPATGRIPQE